MSTLVTIPNFHDKGGATATAPPTADQSRPEECRARAAECQGIADQWPELIKQQYEALASQWRTVAEEFERRKERTADDGSGPLHPPYPMGLPRRALRG